MSAEHDPLEDLLASISDGHSPDWDAAAFGLDPAARARIDALRDVSRIADFSRGLQQAAGETVMPQRWGDMLLLEKIGSGAHAEVFRAWDPGLQREVALKLLHPGAEDSALMDEGRAAARIRHPHVAAVHGVERRDGRVGLWMELIRGPNLEHEARARGPLDPRDAARLGIEIGSALAAVHAAGLLHRDIKPANVLRDGEGRHVLADFGLGLRWDHAALRTAAPSGTPMYMAPELLSGAAASEQSDVYSLGLVLWFALTARHPFDAATIPELTKAAAHGPKPALREVRADLPAALAAIVERAIAPEPRARFASARELVAALEAWQTGGTAPKRRGAWIAAGAVVLLLIVAAALGRRSRPAPVAPVVQTAPPAPSPQAAAYAVEATFLRRGAGGSARLASGDRVRPGDRLSLEVRATRPAWFYVLNEDERGERYLLYPQPRFDLHNPLAAESTFVLPGPVDGKENAWTVTSPGGREFFLVVASPSPVPELEAELNSIRAPEPGRAIRYTAVSEHTVERLRGVGGVAELPARARPPAERSRTFERFRALEARETGVTGVWVRQITLENPAR